MYCKVAHISFPNYNLIQLKHIRDRYSRLKIKMLQDIG